MKCGCFEMADFNDNHDQTVSASVSAKCCDLVNNLLSLAKSERYSVETENMFNILSL
jgi:hypothetical protein